MMPAANDCRGDIVTRRVLALVGALAVWLLFTAAGASAGEQYPPTGEDGGRDKKVKVVKFHEVDGADEGGEGGGELSVTGSSSTVPLVATAAGLMVVGAGLAFGVQRRRTQPA